MWFGVVLGGLALLPVLVLCIPVDVVVHFEAHEQRSSEARLVWLFGLVGWRIGGGEKAQKRGRATVRPAGWRKRPAAALRVLRNPGLLARLVRLVQDILRHIRVRDLAADLRVGLDDPADTGLLFGLIGPLALFLSRLSSRQLLVRPAFDGAVFEGYCRGALRIWPITLLWPLLGFAFSPPVMGALKEAVRSKWTERRWRPAAR